MSCLNRLVMMAMQNEQARVLGKDMIMDIVNTVIDIIVVFKRENGRRQITEYLYDNKIYKKADDNFYIYKDFATKER